MSRIDDHPRFIVSAHVVRRATARPVADALAKARRCFGVPEEALTDNGKVFTSRFGPGNSPVLFELEDAVPVDAQRRSACQCDRSAVRAGLAQQDHHGQGQRPGQRIHPSRRNRAARGSDCGSHRFVVLTQGWDSCGYVVPWRCWLLKWNTTLRVQSRSASTS